MPLPIGPVVAGAVARAAAKKAATKATSKAAKKTATKTTSKAGAKKATTKGGDMTLAQYRTFIAQLEREVRKATGGKYPKYIPRD